MKLNSAALPQFDNEVRKPSYHRDHDTHGIVHIGVGGFHRAHQAVYTERLLQQGAKDWMICGVGLREGDKTMQSVLSEQDYLYTLMELDHLKKTAVSVIGAITNFLYAPEEPEAVLQKLSDPNVRIVSLTITEGGYNVDDNTGEFDLNNPDIVYDLQNQHQPRTVFGYLTEALSRRNKAGIKPFTIMSCDNLPHNGNVAKGAFLAFAEKKDPDLAEWMSQNVSFPNSMVDRITPMTTPVQIAWLKKTYGVDDQWPVICEPFTQWVLEDNFCNGRPEWENVGVQFTNDVAPYEGMKIGLLNASHSAMAYLGYMAHFRYTHEVMGDPDFSQLLREFMDFDVTPVIGDIPGVDIEVYKDTLIQRFSNMQMGDQLARLCMDGSSKIPKFLIPTILQLIENKRPLTRVALIIASWAFYLRQQELNDIQDPLAEKLKRSVSENEEITNNFLGLKDIFPAELINSTAFTEAFENALSELETGGVMTTLKTLNAA